MPKAVRKNKADSQIRHLKKLASRALIVLLPVYFVWWIYIEFFPLYYSSPTAVRWHFIAENLEAHQQMPDADLLFIGESRLNAALDFRQIPRSYSLASGGASPVEMYFMLKKYTDTGSKPDTVFLSVSPRFMSEIFVFWHYAVRTDFFTPSEMRNIFKTAEEFPEDTVLGSFSRMRYALYQLNYPGYYQQDVSQNYAFAAYKENRAMIEEMKKRRGGREHPGLKESCSGLNYETRYQTFRPSPVLLHYFDEVLKLCKQKNIHLIFLFMPFNESSYRALNDDFVCSYENVFDFRQKRFSGFDLGHNIYALPDSLFGDPSHLNGKGKEYYTRRFLKKYFSKK